MSAGAQSFCVRAGASGAGNGASWTDAYAALPASLVRGATYYIADGNYPGHNFKDAEDGSKMIYVKKATPASHGTGTGWLDSYGDGQAAFTSTVDEVTIVFERGYYELDGATGGGPDNWGSGHGFYFTRTTGGYIFDFRGPNWWDDPMPDNIVLRHLEIDGNDVFGVSGIAVGMQGSNTLEAGLGPRNVSISFCYLHDFGASTFPMATNECQNWSFEYNYMARNTVVEGVYNSEGWQDFGSDHVVVRFNKFEDIEGTSVIALKRNWKQNSADWQVYGNIFYWTSANTTEGCGGTGLFGDAREEFKMTDPAWTVFTCTGMLFYNNTIVRCPGISSGVFFPVGSGNLVYNNIWYNCQNQWENVPNTYFRGVTRDYNVFIDSFGTYNQTIGPNDYSAASGDIFVDAALPDLRLKAALPAGLPLGAPYDTDLTGAVRGSSGVWDRGAYQSASAAPTLLPPSGLRLRTP